MNLLAGGEVEFSGNRFFNLQSAASFATAGWDQTPERTIA